MAVGWGKKEKWVVGLREVISVINFSKSWKRKTFSCGTIHSLY